MLKSKYKEYKRYKKELIPPMVNALGEILSLSSWSKDRVPEYIWLALVRKSCFTKKEYFEKFHTLYLIFKERFAIVPIKMSEILELEEDAKLFLYNNIRDVFGSFVLDSLVVVIDDPILRKIFYNVDNCNDKRIKNLSEVVGDFYDRYSNCSMDIRFSVIWLSNIVLSKDCEIVIEAMTRYPYVTKKEEIDKYAVVLSSLEGAVSNIEKKSNSDYLKMFNRIMYLYTDCKPMVIQYEKEVDMEVIISKVKDLKKLLIKCNETYLDTKKEILVGNISYIYKLINEIIDTKSTNSISSRLILRTIAEIYVNIKYMVKAEKDEPKIWESYKDYGCGKYVNIYKKIEDGLLILNPESHFDSKIIELIANEHKSTEYIKISFENFDKLNINKKFELVDEKNLYGTLYDYDTCFVHGYWGAIRESSMLLCENVVHNYHSVPDFESEQKLKDCSFDLINIIDKIIIIINEEMEVK